MLITTIKKLPSSSKMLTRTNGLKKRKALLKVLKMMIKRVLLTMSMGKKTRTTESQSQKMEAIVL